MLRYEEVHRPSASQQGQLPARAAKHDSAQILVWLTGAEPIHSMVAPGDHTIALIVIVRSDEWMILFSHQAVSIDRPLMGEPGGV
jgi:hypothetical protein